MDRDYSNFYFDIMFMNSDNNLGNLRIGEEKWKVWLIEDVFKKRMWEIIRNLISNKITF